MCVRLYIVHWGSLMSGHGKHRFAGLLAMLCEWLPCVVVLYPQLFLQWTTDAAANQP